MCRWIDFLAEFEMQIQHRPGIRHGNADGCSRAITACKQCHLSAEAYEMLDKAAEHKDERQQQAREIEMTVPGMPETGRQVGPPQLTVMMKRVKRQLPANTEQDVGRGMATAQRLDEDIGPVYAVLEGATEQPELSRFN
jgi:hypothetical protein